MLGRSKEKTPKSAEKKRRLPLKTIGILGAVAVGFAVAPSIDKSGDLEQASPTTPKYHQIDQKHVQLSWNMHNETRARTSQIKKLIDQNNVDAALLQEVNRQDFRYLAKKMPEHYLSYVMADIKSKPIEGGFGNVIITRQKPRDVRTISFDGSSLLGGIVHAVSGLREDIAHAETGLPTARQAWLADRSAIAMTISVQKGQDLQDIRIVNSHIEGDERLNDEQFKKVTNFIKSNSKNGRPTFFCGDLNTPPEQTIPLLADIGHITPQTRATQAVERGEVLDYCSYTTEGAVGLAKINVLDNPHTDHYPLLAEWGAVNPGSE